MKIFSNKVYIKFVAIIAISSIFFPPVMSSWAAFELFSRETKTVSTGLPSTETEKVVSILVEKELLEFSGLRSKIKRYATDVQKAVNAKTILIPIPTNLSPKEIYEGNAALYFSGIEQDEKSQLIGTVLIGEVPLPVVSQNGRPYVSPWPYTDFENPDYEWNNQSEQFDFVGGDKKAEIWHGIIRSDITGGTPSQQQEKRVAELEDFFNTNNAFHKGQITYGKKGLHVNLPFQKNGLPPLMKQSYEKYIENLEDILYGRFTKERAAELFEDQGLDEILDPALLPEGSGAVPEVDFSGLPDVFSKQVIEQIQRRYVELYKGYISSLNTNIEQSGRWDASTVETTFSLVSKKDEYAAQLVKNFSDAIEKKIFNAVAESDIPAEISLPKGGTIKKSDCLDPTYLLNNPTNHGADLCSGADNDRYIHFSPYWNGIKIDLTEAEKALALTQNKVAIDFDAVAPTFDFSIASQCSLLRGSAGGKMVEMSRAFSFKNINESETNETFHCDQNESLTRACGQIFSTEGLPDFEQARFADMSNFNYDFSPAHFGQALAIGADVDSSSSVYKFYGERYPLLDLTASELVASGKIGAQGCEDIIWQKNKNLVPVGVRADIENNLQTFSSLANHVEPTKLTIETQLASIKDSPAAHLPVDAVRGFSFYDASFDFQKVSYPNFFNFRDLFLTSANRSADIKTGIENSLNQKIVQLNGFSAGNEIETDLFDEILDDFDTTQLAEALVWLDKPLEQKNTEMFLATLKDVSTAKSELVQPNFSGVEIFQLFAESAEVDSKKGIKVDFERSNSDDVSRVFAEAELEHLNFSFTDKDSAAENVFAGSANGAFSAEDENCDRSLLKWAGSCLVPWLEELPNVFGNFTKLIPSVDESGEIKPAVVAATATKPTVLGLKLSTEKLIIQSKSVLPQMVEVSVVDENNVVQENNFQTEIQVELPNGFNVNGKIEKTVKNGVAKFFFTPADDIKLGRHTIKFIADEKVVSSLPVIVTADTFQILTSDVRAEAGQIEPVKIEIKLQNEAGEKTRKYDGTDLSFSTEVGSFTTNSQVTIKNGIATIDWLPGNKAVEKNNIKVSHPELSVQSINLDVYAASASQVVYESASDVLVSGASDGVIVQAFLADRFENKIQDSTNFDWTFAGVKSEKIDGSTQKIWPINQADEYWAIADVKTLEQRSAKKNFSTVVSPQVFVTNVSQNIIAGDQQKSVMSLEVRDTKGDLVAGNFETKIVLSSNDGPDFPTEILFKNGKAVVEFLPGIKAQNVTGKIISAGFIPTNFSFTVNPAAPKKIEIIPTEKIIDADGGSKKIEFLVKDVYGNVVSNYSDFVYVRLNPKDRKSLDLSDSGLSESNQLAVQNSSAIKSVNDLVPSWIGVNPALEQQTIDVDNNSDPEDSFYASKVYFSNGKGFVKIAPEGVAGNINILVQKNGLVPATDTFEVTKVLTNSDFSALQPQTLLALLHGWDAANFSAPNMANRFLFDGNAQAVVGDVSLVETPKMVGFIHPNGDVSESFESKIVEDNKPKFEILQSGKLLANLTLHFSKNHDVFLQSLSEELLESGVYWRVPQSQKSKFEFDRSKILYNEIPLIEFRTDGGILVLSEKIKLMSTDDWNKQVVEFEGKPVAELVFWQNKSAFVKKNKYEFSPNLFQRLGANVFSRSIKKSAPLVGVEMVLEDTNFDTERLLVGKRSTEAKGIAFFDRYESEEAAKLLASSSYEAAQTDWVGPEKIATIFAAKNTAGAAWQLARNKNKVLLGDPTIRVLSDNIKNSLQLTNDIGTPVWQESDRLIDEVFSGDLNLDGKNEIFPLVGENLSVLYADPNQTDSFRDAGKILRFPDGLRSMAIYEKKNVIQFLIQVDGEGNLIFFENKEGRFERIEKNIGLNRVWTEVKIGDLNGDNWDDLVLLDENNTLYVVHGKESKDFEAPTKLYSFLSEIEAAEETYSRYTFNPDKPEENNFEYLSDVFVKYQAAQAVPIRIAADIGGVVRAAPSARISRATTARTTDFQPFVNNGLVNGTFALKPHKKSEINTKVKAEFEFTVTAGLKGLEFVLPEIEGLKLDEESVACSSCGDLETKKLERGVLVKNLLPAVGRKQKITWNYEIFSIPKISYLIDDFSGNDGKDDVVVPWTDANGKPQNVAFISNGSLPDYPNTLYAVPSLVAPRSSDVLQFLKGQVFRNPVVREVSGLNNPFIKTHTFKILVDENVRTDYSNLDPKDLAETAFDALTGAGFETQSVEDTVKGFSCGGGSCGLQIPSYVFMGPGQQSLYLPPISIPSIPTLPIPIVGLPSLQIIPSIPFVLPFVPSLPASVFRMFVMPSITGQVGIAACLGVPNASIPPIPVGNCFAFVPPISLFGSCSDDSVGVLGALASMDGNTGSYKAPTIKVTDNKKLISADIITAWVQAQYEEFSNYKFPNINFILPKFAQKKEGPKVKKSIWEKLEDSEFVKVNRNPVYISYPSFSKDSLDSAKNGLNSYKKNFKVWKKNSIEKISQTAPDRLQTILKAKLLEVGDTASIEIINGMIKRMPQKIEEKFWDLDPADQLSFSSSLSQTVTQFSDMLEVQKPVVLKVAEKNPKAMESYNEARGKVVELEDFVAMLEAIAKDELVKSSLKKSAEAQAAAEVKAVSNEKNIVSPVKVLNSGDNKNLKLPTIGTPKQTIRVPVKTESNQKAGLIAPVESKTVPAVSGKILNSDRTSNTPIIKVPEKLIETEPIREENSFIKGIKDLFSAIFPAVFAQVSTDTLSAEEIKKERAAAKAKAKKKVAENKAAAKQKKDELANKGEEKLEETKAAADKKKEELKNKAASAGAEKQKAIEKKLETELVNMKEKLKDPSYLFDPLDENITRVVKNVETLDVYYNNGKTLKKLPQKIEELSVDTSAVTDLVNEYFAEWQNENTKKAKEWERFQKDLDVTFKSWKSIPEVFTGLTARCPSCNVNRGTVISWFFKVILGAIKLPVIPIPKFPDITLDLSNAGIGLDVTIPDVKLRPTEIKVPDVTKALPQLDSDVLLAALVVAFEESFTVVLPEVEALVDPIIDEILDEIITSLPEISAQLNEYSFDSLEELNSILVSAGIAAFMISEMPKIDLQAKFEGVLNLVLADFSIPNIDTLVPNISLPNIPLLPAVPDFSKIPLDFSVPVVDLPQLPVILSPPVLPNFLAPLQKILAIPKPFFNLFCYLMLGIIPVPEWKLASHIQEKTNRTDLFEFLDFVPGALFKSTKKKDVPDKNIKFDGVYTKQLEQLNQSVLELKAYSDCSIKNLASGNFEPCDVTEILDSVPKFSATNRFENTEKEVVVLVDKTTKSSGKSVLIAQKEIELVAKHSTELLQENKQKLLAQLNVKPDSKLSKSLLASNEIVSAESVQASLANVVPLVEPKINYYDPATNRSVSVTNYKILGRNHTSLKTDLERDGKDEIIYAIENELYIKRRSAATNKVRSSSSVLSAIRIGGNNKSIEWTTEKFVSLFVPTNSVRTEIYANGSELELNLMNPEVGYYEWNISDRPDVWWEENRGVASRSSEVWRRIGMLVRPEPKKYQVRPTSAQIVRVSGASKLISPRRASLPTFENKNACVDKTIQKPFYATETLLIGTTDDTTFRIETKKRKGEEPKSFWKKINAGEEIRVDFAEICVISGSLEVVSFSDPLEFQPKENDYFPPGARLETTKDSAVELLIDGKYALTVSNGETYQLESFTGDVKTVSGFENLPIGNFYGNLWALKDGKRSAVMSKFLHAPNAVDDTEDPKVVLSAGSVIDAEIFAPITIDASASFDNVGFKKIEWQAEGFNFETQTGLILNIPVQTAPTEIAVKLTLTDFANNKISKDITVSVKAPKISFGKTEVEGIEISTETKSPFSLWRNRAGRTEEILKNIRLSDKNLFEFVPKNESENIEIWQKNPRKKIVTIYPTGRVLLADANFETKIIGANNQAGSHLLVSQKNGTAVARLNFSFGKKLDVSFDSTADVQLQDVLSRDEYVWKSLDTDVAGLKNSWALTNNITNRSEFLIDEWGNFYALNSALEMKIKSGSETENLSINIKKSNQTIASFSLPAVNILVQ